MEYSRIQFPSPGDRVEQHLSLERRFSPLHLPAGPSRASPPGYPRYGDLTTGCPLNSKRPIWKMRNGTSKLEFSVAATATSPFQRRSAHLQSRDPNSILCPVAVLGFSDGTLLRRLTQRERTLSLHVALSTLLHRIVCDGGAQTSLLHHKVGKKPRSPPTKAGSNLWGRYLGMGWGKHKKGSSWPGRGALPVLSCR